MFLINQSSCFKNLLVISTLFFMVGSMPLLACDDEDHPKITNEEEVMEIGSPKPGGDDDPDGQRIQAGREVQFFYNEGSDLCPGIPEIQAVPEADCPRFKCYQSSEGLLINLMDVMLEAIKAGDWASFNPDRMVQELKRFLGQIMELPDDDSELDNKVTFLKFCLIFFRQSLLHAARQSLLHAARQSPDAFILPHGLEWIQSRDCNAMDSSEFEGLIKFILAGFEMDSDFIIQKVNKKWFNPECVLWQMCVHAHTASGDLLEFCKSCLRVDCFKSLLNVVDNCGYTPLHYAACNGDLEVVAALINTGAAVNVKCRNLSTPLHIAATFGYLDILLAIINARADVNARTSYEYTPLHNAVQGGRPEIVIALLEKNADINARTSYGDTPMDSAVCHRKNFFDHNSLEYQNYTAIIKCLENAQRSQEEEAAAANAIFAEQVRIWDRTAAGYGQDDENPFGLFPLLSFSRRLP
jgi:hypothetical protein